jgi:hypothetical protein
MVPVYRSAASQYGMYTYFPQTRAFVGCHLSDALIDAMVNPNVRGFSQVL